MPQVLGTETDARNRLIQGISQAGQFAVQVNEQQKAQRAQLISNAANAAIVSAGGDIVLASRENPGVFRDLFSIYAPDRADALVQGLQGGAQSADFFRQQIQYDLERGRLAYEGSTPKPGGPAPSAAPAAQAPLPPQQTTPGGEQQPAGEIAIPVSAYASGRTLVSGGEPQEPPPPKPGLFTEPDRPMQPVTTGIPEPYTASRRSEQVQDFFRKTLSVSMADPRKFQTAILDNFISIFGIDPRTVTDEQAKAAGFSGGKVGVDFFWKSLQGDMETRFRPILGQAITLTNQLKTTRQQIKSMEASETRGAPAYAIGPLIQRLRAQEVSIDKSLWALSQKAMETFGPSYVTEMDRRFIAQNDAANYTGATARAVDPTGLAAPGAATPPRTATGPERFILPASAPGSAPSPTSSPAPAPSVGVRPGTGATPPDGQAPTPLASGTSSSAPSASAPLQPVLTASSKPVITPTEAVAASRVMSAETRSATARWRATPEAGAPVGWEGRYGREADLLQAAQADLPESERNNPLANPLVWDLYFNKNKEQKRQFDLMYGLDREKVNQGWRQLQLTEEELRARAAAAMLAARSAGAPDASRTINSLASVMENRIKALSTAFTGKDLAKAIAADTVYQQAQVNLGILLKSMVPMISGAASMEEFLKAFENITLPSATVGGLPLLGWGSTLSGGGPIIQERTSTSAPAPQADPAVTQALQGILGPSTAPGLAVPTIPVPEQTAPAGASFPGGGFAP